jgi:hypothetical protein
MCGARKGHFSPGPLPLHSEDHRMLVLYHWDDGIEEIDYCDNKMEETICKDYELDETYDLDEIYYSDY